MSLYKKMIASFKEAIEEGNLKVAQDIKSNILKNFKGRDVEAEVGEIWGVKTKREANKNLRIATFTIDDFTPEKKKVSAPTIQVVAEDEVNSRVGNMFKATLEQSDEQLKLKFNNDIEVAIEFLNSIRETMDLDLIEEGQFKSFSKKFFDMFRSTLSTRIS